MQYFFHGGGKDKVYLTSTARKYGTITLDLDKLTAIQLLGTRNLITLSDGATLEHHSECDDQAKAIYEGISADMLELRPDES